MPISFKHVGFEWPNGSCLFNDLNLNFEHQIYGLVGPNGSGKSTLARLMSGDLSPSHGRIEFGLERVHYFEQHQWPAPISILEYLLDSDLFEDPRLLALLGNLPLEQSCAALSGGQWARVRLVKAIGSKASFIILDEPTNHMDQIGRQVIDDFLNFYQGGIILISHDRSLLERVDKIVELSNQGVDIFSGAWSEYEKWRSAERERLKLKLEDTKKQRNINHEQRQVKIEKQAKRQHQGQKQAERGGMPKILLGARKRKAQATMGTVDQCSRERLDQSVSDAYEAYQRLKVDPLMFAELPKVELARGKLLMEAHQFNFQFRGGEHKLWAQDLNFAFYGPARIGIAGVNGSGKSSLLQLLNGDSLAGCMSGSLSLGAMERGYLDQNYNLLDHKISVLANVQTHSALNEIELRNKLAMFLFHGDRVLQKVAELSGGEKLRAALAKVLLAKHPAQLLILDEPTNNLDMANIEFLEKLLNQYEGALIVISHDQKFIEQLRLDHMILL